MIHHAELSDDLRVQMRGRLDRFPRRALTADDLRPAAVALIATSDADGRPSLLLEKRPLTMRRHAGQFALPGGRLDGGETAFEAAVREVDEELGLVLTESDSLGVLDDYETRSGFCITPFVFWCPGPLALTPDPNEVATLHYVTFEELLADEVVHLDPIPESDRPVLSLAVLNNRVFAPTAALILQFREVALLDRKTRVDGYEQPVFAWR